MYAPKQHEELDVAVLHSLVRSHPLGAWVTLAQGELVANHVPFLLDPTRGELGTLVGHVARANEVWKSYSETTESVVMFQGPQCYITPSWYPSKHEHGRAVPTWNYAVVHVHGIPRAIEGRDWLYAHVNELTDRHEAERALPWRVADAPVEYMERMLQSVVGIEIPITRLFGKWKVSQNRSDPDKLGVVAGLLERPDDVAREMASLVRQHVSSRKGS